MATLARIRVLVEVGAVEISQPMFVAWKVRRDPLRSEKVNVDLRDVSEGTVDLMELMNYSTVLLAKPEEDSARRYWPGEADRQDT